MLKTTIKTVCLAAVALVSTLQVSKAALITGEINLTGQLTMLRSNGATTANVLNASKFSISSTVIGTATGDFAGISGTGTWVSPYVFNPGTLYTTLFQLAGFSAELVATTYSTETPAYGNFINISGAVVMNLPGFEPTFGLYSFSISQPKASPTATVGYTAKFTPIPQIDPGPSSVPDGGTTAALLGVSLLGVYGARRKFGRKI